MREVLREKGVILKRYIKTIKQKKAMETL